jgi:hypothetical protein
MIMTSFSQCSSSQKLQEKAPATFGEVYFQRWNAGIQDGGSGINLFIPVTDTNVVLDSVYFRGKSAKLETKPTDTSLYVGRFKTEFNQPKDIVMSSNPLDEYNNPLPIQKERMPFTLKDSECVLSYKDGQTTKYFKIENIIEKEAINYPSAPNNKH